MYVCMYVYMSFRNRFTIEKNGFMYSLRTFWHVLLRMPSHDGGMESRSRTRRIEEDARMESRCMEDD